MDSYIGSDLCGDTESVAGVAGRALPRWGRGVRGGGLHRVAVCGRGADRGRARAHLADPAEVAAARGPKKRAKTDRADARLLRTLLWEGRLPESVIPPAQVLEVRTLGRLYCALMDERRAWQQRIQAQLFHQGCPPITALLSPTGRDGGQRRIVGGRAPVRRHRAGPHR